LITVQGALHQDLFLATSLRVMTPGANAGPNGQGHPPGAPPAAPVQ
jgi:hypothetical protein